MVRILGHLKRGRKIKRRINLRRSLKERKIRTIKATIGTNQGNNNLGNKSTSAGQPESGHNTGPIRSNGPNNRQGGYRSRPRPSNLENYDDVCGLGHYQGWYDDHGPNQQPSGYHDDRGPQYYDGPQYHGPDQQPGGYRDDRGPQYQGQRRYEVGSRPHYFQEPP